jgi:hypothetical protein
MKNNFQGGLVDIPVITAPGGPLQLAQQEPDRLKSIVEISHKLIPSFLLCRADKFSEQWLIQANNPYRAEINRIASLLGCPGAHALNLCFEWGCTTGYRTKSYDAAADMVRTLDWPFRLGAEVVVARHQPAAGEYYNITWPGYVGVLTAMAPGRFAAAINQAPMAYTFGAFGLTMPIDWLVNRFRVRDNTAIPPAHLLRHVFDHCRSYDEAKHILTTTPLCISVIFTLTGARPGEACIIERRETAACVHTERSDCVANHWLNPDFRGRDRRIQSRKRRTTMLETLTSFDGRFDWLQAPVLNAHTRLAVEMNAAAGTLRVQGLHGAERVTNIREIAV